jgi:hypothetical protein
LRGTGVGTIHGCRHERTSAAAPQSAAAPSPFPPIANYVVDTSFFPSIGAVNPALTAMANALRVGDRRLELGAGRLEKEPARAA